MKKLAILALLGLSACGSLRNGRGNTEYITFFGISIEALAMGDGIYVRK